MKLRRIPKLYISSTIICISCFFWMFPQGLSLLLSEYNTYINLCKCALWGFALLNVLRKRIRLTKFTVMLHIFWMLFLISILVSDRTINNINTWLTLFCSVCGMALLFERYPDVKVVPLIFKYMFVLVVINTILLVVLPGGFTYYLSSSDGLSKFQSSSNFISTDNNYIPFLIAFLLMGEFCYDYYMKSKAVYIWMWLLSWGSMLMIFSATGIIGLLVYSIVIYFFRRKRRYIKLKFSYIVIMAAAVFVAVYVFHVQRLFSFLIVNILGKDITLTQRLGLWSRAIEMIIEKPIFGYGNKRYGAIILREYYYWYAHNLVLDVLLEGGLVTFTGFALFLSSFVKAIRKHISSRPVQKIIYALIPVMLVNLTESYFSSLYFYLPFMLGVFICKGNKKKRNNRRLICRS